MVFWRNVTSAEGGFNTVTGSESNEVVSRSRSSRSRSGNGSGSGRQAGRPLCGNGRINHKSKTAAGDRRRSNRMEKKAGKSG